MTEFEERASGGRDQTTYVVCGQDHCPLPQEHLHLSTVPLPRRWTLGCSSKRGGIFWIVLYKIYMSLCFCMCAKPLQLCPTLCNPMDYSLSVFSVHGILQARILGVGCCVLLQGIFLTQGLNSHLLCLLYWQADSLPLAPPGKLLEEQIVRQHGDSPSSPASFLGWGGASPRM